MDQSSEIQLQTTAAEIRRLLERHRVLETLARQQDTTHSVVLESLQHRQNLVELQRRVSVLHPADIAHLLDSLSGDDRSIVWRELGPRLAGQALVEVSTEVREALIDETPRE